MTADSTLQIAAQEIVGSGSGLRQLWRSRDLLANLTAREFSLKYQRSLLGFGWTLLNPILTVTILLAVFTRVIRVPIPDYWAFLLSGYFAWHFMSYVLNSGGSMLLEYKAMIRSAPIPNEVPVLAHVFSRLLESAIEIAAVALLVAVAHHGSLPASYSLLPLLLAMQLLIATGLVLPVAAYSIFYFDVRQMLPIVLTAMFYVTPVFYSLDLVPQPFRYVLLLNPIAGLLSLYQSVLYEGRIPPAWALLAMSSVSIALAWIGYAIFNRKKSAFAEIM